MPLLLNITPNIEEINQDIENNILSPPEKEFNIKSSAPDPIIHITGTNWTWAVGNGTATGTGTWGDPYIIQDKVIDGNQADFGIRIQNSDNYYFRIENCTIYNCKKGGIYFTSVKNGTIINCNVSNNDDGVPTNNEGNGIWTSASDNNTIINNILFNNSEYGIYMGTSDDNIIQGNIIKNNSRHGVAFVTNSYRNEIINNHIVNNSYFGLTSSNGYDHIIRGNVISDNGNDGLRFYGGNGINITENIIRRNQNGVEIEWTSTGFVIYKNYFIGNTLHANDDVGGNEFNSSSVGNYWDNYTGNDNSPYDGIGDTPYNFIGGGMGAVDNYPIHQNPIHNGEPIHIDETGASAFNWSRTALLKDWINGKGSASDPYIIEDLVIDAGSSGSCITIGNSTANFFQIDNCSVSNSGSGTYDAGIYLRSTDNGLLTNNDCTKNKFGIYLYSSDWNKVSGNAVYNNTDSGIKTEFSYYNNITQNEAYNNTVRGFYHKDCDHSYFLNNVVQDNLVNGIQIQGSGNNSISGNTVSNNANGIGIFTSADNNNVTNNNITSNTGFGLALTRADYTKVTDNLIKDNLQGLWIFYGLPNAHDNNIYNNTFIGNQIHAIDEVATNFWNNTDTGNYWDNYTGSDNNGDGIGDIPHIISRAPVIQDHFPIWDISSNITIDGDATGVGAHNWTWAVSQLWCSGSGIYGDPYIISGVKLNVGNSGDCISIQDSTVYFKIQDCTFQNSGTAVGDAGIKFNNVDNGIVENNICINNRIAISLLSSQHNMISNNKFNKSSQYGIYLMTCDDNTFKQNTIENSSDTGIIMADSNGNVFTLNEIINNTNYGAIIADGSSTFNYFYKNAFFDNGIHARDLSGATPNYWNNSVIGNYWDNHSTNDVNKDGIDDMEYEWIVGTAGINDSLPIYGDPRHDGKWIHVNDDIGSAINWTWASSRFWCSGSGTFADPYLIEDLNIDAENNNQGILIEASITKYFIIRNCEVYNGSLGFPVTIGGIDLDAARNGLIINNTIYNCNSVGIKLDYCQNVTVTSNQIYDNEIYGIHIKNSDNNTISYNEINNTIQYAGLYMQISDNNSINDNMVNNTKSNSGLIIGSGADNNTFVNNHVYNSLNDGISVFTAHSNIFINNKALNNGRYGFRLEDSDNNKLIGNLAQNNTEHGLLIDDSHSCIIDGNTFMYNNGSGIFNDRANFTIITDNTVSNNKLSGIEIHESVSIRIEDNANSFNYNTYAGIYLKNCNGSTISGNIANYNYIGIVLNFSHNNEINGNTFIGNTYWRNVTSNSTGNVFLNNNYGQGTQDGNGDDDGTPPEPPMGFMMIIIIGAIIGAVAVVGGVVAKGKTSKEGKETVEQKKLKPKAAGKQKLKVKIKQKGPTLPPILPKGPKKAKKDEIEFEDESKELSPEEKEELQKTEEEVDVEKQKFICVVHKGPIKADNIYLCPGCQTFYCVNCAKALKVKGEKCWSCDMDIQLKTEAPQDIPSETAPADKPDMVEKALEFQAKIKKYDVYIQQAETMVQKLDIKYGAGEISTEEFMEKKTLLAEKIGEAMAKRDQLKE